MDFRLAVAVGTRLNCVANVCSRVQRAHDVQTGRLDDVLEGPTRVDRKADRAAADGQAGNALRSLCRQEKRRGCPNVRADDVRSTQPPFVDQTLQEGPCGVRGNQFWTRLVGMSESGQVDGDHPAEPFHVTPDATEGPHGLRPRREQQQRGIRV